MSRRLLLSAPELHLLQRATAARMRSLGGSSVATTSTPTTTTARSILGSKRGFSFGLFRIPQAPNPSLQPALNRAVAVVQQHDPSGDLPGRLLPQECQIPYYVARCIWIESGLRKGFTTTTTTTGIINPAAVTSTPQEHLEWWQRGIDAACNSSSSSSSTDTGSTTTTTTDYLEHPTLNLLQYLIHHHPGGWSDTPESQASVQHHFDTILSARRHDLNVSQYDTLDNLIQYVQHTCAPLLQLVLESGGRDATSHPMAHHAALWVGTCHGLSNALRTSIPVVSTTGKLIIPADLCVKHGVRSPRYLLSALGQGDETCVQALQYAVQDIANKAREALMKARELQPQLRLESHNDNSNLVSKVLLPGLASETFLNRLAAKQYKLTDRSLRNVGWMEHAQCAGTLFHAAYVTHTY